MRNLLKPAIVLLIVTVSALASLANGAESPPPGGRLADGSAVPSDAVFSWASPPSQLAISPRYPPKFAKAGIGGNFEGDALISETGEVIEVHVQQGIHPEFDAAIIEHVREVTFRPAVLNGVPVASRYKLIFDFAPDASRQAR